MSLWTERTPSPMVPGKRQFDERKNYRNPTNIPKFKRSRTDLVLNFAKHCGPFSTENEQGSVAAVAVTPLRIVPSNHENGDGIDGTERGMPMEFNSAIAPKNFNDDDLGRLMKSECEAFNIPKSGMGSSFGNSCYEKLKMKDLMKSKGKSIRVDYDDGDDDDRKIIEEKSSNILPRKAVDDNQYVLGPVIPKGEVSKRYEFEWVEVVDGDICFLSPSEWQNLIHNKSKSGKDRAENFTGVTKQEVDVNELENMSIGPCDAATEIGTPYKVQEVLNLYQELFTKLSLQDVEELNRGTSRKQVYVKAAMILKRENKWINTKQTFGHVPGVEIGDLFQFRDELVVIGLHHEFICGINCVTMGGETYALSVVDSGRYENKVKSANVLIYSGQGGNPRFYTKLEDQKLEGGNLALKNSMDAKFPVRVIPFNEDGAIVRAKKMVYECGPNCRCPPSCQNRVSQHGPKIPLEVFRTKSTGWGVRSPVAIESGSFICEYIGELLKDEVADQRTNDQYLFDLGDGEGYSIDAAKYGNVSRFINHSCSPNLYAQNVLYDHDDKKLPHVMLFATENIPPLEELTYHYNYKVDRVCDANGNIKKKNCCCGSRVALGGCIKDCIKECIFSFLESSILIHLNFK